MNNFNDPNNGVNKNANEETYRSRSRSKNKKKQNKSKFNLNFLSKKKSSDDKSADGEVKAFSLKDLDKKKLLLIAACGFLAICLAVIIYVAVIIITAPDIETDDIYSMLSQSSVLYDDDGVIMDTAFSDQNRTIVEISEIPDHVQYAFIALEDKTFETHNGFNIIRIFGAIKDAVFNGGHISGTSTITQQLSRNLYLQDEMYDRNISRKIKEAYYAVQLESELNKDQILEAYLTSFFISSATN